MKEYDSGAYLVSRGSYKRASDYKKPRRGKAAAGVLIAILLMLTAGICALVYFLSRTQTASGTPVFAGKTFYFLAIAQETDRTEALKTSQYAVERGGAGYIYNDGSYHTVAAVYDREADVKTLVSVNSGSHYFALSLAQSAHADGDRAALEYLAGEWFDTVMTAATELDRGNISDSAAEHAVRAALIRLEKAACLADSEYLKTALEAVCEYSIPQGRSVLSYIRYIHVRAVAEVIAVLNA
ncbi:MAG: hypothetical protein NC184_02930 [Roseburia sp.]|nr:hypothetical protein [Roseburia sp.]